MKFALRGQTRTFTFTFTDRQGAPLTPDTKEAYVYDPSNTLMETLSTFVDVSPGVYEVDYAVAVDAEEGRWEIVCKGTKGTATAYDTQAFKVVSWHVPEVEEIRASLGNLSDQLVPTTTIESKINLAYTRVRQNASGTATQDLKEEATLAWALYLTYKEYVAVRDRGPGITAASTVLLQIYKEEAEEFLKYIRRGAPVFKAPVDQPDTLLEQYIEGELSDAADFY